MFLLETTAAEVGVDEAAVLELVPEGVPEVPLPVPDEEELAAPITPPQTSAGLELLAPLAAAR